MNRNYSDIEYGQTNTFMSIMLMTNITLDMWMWGPLNNKCGFIVKCKNVWTNSYAGMYAVL